MTKFEFLNELVDELVDAAVDFGENPNKNNELALAEASELLNKAMKKIVVDKAQKE